MPTTKKLLLSIPSLFGVFYLLTFFFPGDFVWLFPSMKAYNYQMIGVFILHLIQIIWLIRRVWSFKHIPLPKKKQWTGLLIFFGSISSLIYIWSVDGELQNERSI